MASMLLCVTLIQTIFLQTAFTQCVNRVSNCAPNLLPCEYLPFETIIPNQILVNPVLPVTLPALPNCLPGVPAPYPVLPAPYPVLPAIPPAYQALQAVAEPVLYPSAVVNDNSVANNLADALQLLVVSNLLSSTLPGGCDPYFIEPYPIRPIGPYNVPYPSSPYPVLC